MADVKKRFIDFAAVTAIADTDTLALWSASNAAMRKIVYSDFKLWTKSGTTMRPNIAGNYILSSSNDGNIAIIPHGSGFVDIGTANQNVCMAFQDTVNDVGAPLNGIIGVDKLEITGDFGYRASRFYDTTLLGWGDFVVYGQAGTVDPGHSFHLVAYGTADLYPMFNLVTYDHSNIQMVWDAYTLDGSNWLSSNAASFRSIKDPSNLRFQGAATAGAGDPITWLDIFTMDASGKSALTDMVSIFSRADSNCSAFQFVPIGHANLTIGIDAYWNDTAWLSSSAAGNYRLHDDGGVLKLLTSSGNPEGFEISSWDTVFSVSPETGEMTIPNLSSTTAYLGWTYVSNDLTVTGNLYVNGTEFIANTETMVVEDNLIFINHGEAGSGVTKGYAGMTIDRGSANQYGFMFNEAQDNFRVGEFWISFDYNNLTGAFSLNEEIIGTSSGAKGYIIADTGSNLKLKGTTGTFADTEVITGQTSGATANVNGTPTVNDSTQAVATRQDTPTANAFPLWNNTNARFDTVSTYTYDSATGQMKLPSGVSFWNAVPGTPPANEIYAYIEGGAFKLKNPAGNVVILI